MHLSVHRPSCRDQRAAASYVKRRLERPGAPLSDHVIDAHCVLTGREAPAAAERHCHLRRDRPRTGRRRRHVRAIAALADRSRPAVCASTRKKSPIIMAAEAQKGARV